MSKIDIESAVEMINQPQPTYEDMMKAVALQLQSTSISPNTSTATDNPRPGGRVCSHRTIDRTVTHSVNDSERDCTLAQKSKIDVP